MQNELIADNSLLLDATKARLERLGVPAFVVSRGLEGDASEVGAEFARALLAWARDGGRLKTPFGGTEVSVQPGSRLALLYGGETTVRFPEGGAAPGARGGRNQEMALALLSSLRRAGSAPAPWPPFLFASLGSDGQDGPTDAAGALVSEQDVLLGEAREPELAHLDTRLAQKDSYAFWSRFRDGACLVKTGKTGTNLMDMQVLMLGS